MTYTAFMWEPQSQQVLKSQWVPPERYGALLLPESFTPI